MSLSFHVSSLSFMFAGALAGCAIESTEPLPELEARPLVTIPAEDGSTVELFEVAPGIIAVSEAGPKGVEPILTPELAAFDPETLFETLRPADMARPVRLTEALARRRELVETGNLPADDIAQWKLAAGVPDPWNDAGVGTTEQGIYLSNSSGNGADRTAFIEKYCVNQTGNFLFCDLDRVGSDTRTRNDVEQFQCVGATYANTATMKFRYRTWWDWTTYNRWTVPKDTWRKVYTDDLAQGGLDYDGECSMATWTNCTPFDYACILATPKAEFHMAGWGRY